MTILSILRDALVGKTITLYQSVENPTYFGTIDPEECYSNKQVTRLVTDVTYVSPYITEKQAGGDYFEVHFEDGSVMLTTN